MSVIKPTYEQVLEQLDRLSISAPHLQIRPTPRCTSLHDIGESILGFDPTLSKPLKSEGGRTRDQYFNEYISLLSIRKNLTLATANGEAVAVRLGNKRTPSEDIHTILFSGSLMGWVSKRYHDVALEAYSRAESINALHKLEPLVFRQFALEHKEQVAVLFRVMATSHGIPTETVEKWELLPN